MKKIRKSRKPKSPENQQNSALKAENPGFKETLLLESEQSDLQNGNFVFQNFKNRSGKLQNKRDLGRYIFKNNVDNLSSWGQNNYDFSYNSKLYSQTLQF